MSLVDEQEKTEATMAAGLATYTSPEDQFGLLRSYNRHLMFVRLALKKVEQALEQRGIVHDASKMLDDEYFGFSRINAAARINKFGSPGYAENMKRERPTIDLHFSRNSHHPEYSSVNHEALTDAVAKAHSGGYVGMPKPGTMTFLDVIEMVCDWHGARKGYDDPRSWEASVDLNLEQKGKYLTAEQRWLVREVATFLETA